MARCHVLVATSKWELRWINALHCRRYIFTPWRRRLAISSYAAPGRGHRWCLASVTGAGDRKKGLLTGCPELGGHIRRHVQ